METGGRGKAPDDGDRAVRRFIFKLALFVSVWGALFFRGEWLRYGYWLAGWAAVLGLGLAAPGLFRPIRRGAVRLGSWIGHALAWLALAGIYYLAIVPLGLAARLAGKKFLTKGKDASADTYWLPRAPAPEDKASWERQY